MFAHVLFAPILISFLLHVVVLANTEKIIISAPPTSLIPSSSSLSALAIAIPILNPSDWSTRHHIPAAFPSDSLPDGLPSWYLLTDLSPGQGYEIRVCWAATQPTTFKLSVHSPNIVFDDPSLKTSLISYSESRISALGRPSHTDNPLPGDSGSGPGEVGAERSALLLQIFAAADYFSTNATLMSNVPPVFVDVILDPHVIPGVPRSLVSTIGCVIVVAVGSFFLARNISAWLTIMAAGLHSDPRKIK